MSGASSISMGLFCNQKQYVARLDGFIDFYPAGLSGFHLGHLRMFHLKRLYYLIKFIVMTRDLNLVPYSQALVRHFYDRNADLIVKMRDFTNLNVHTHHLLMYIFPLIFSGSKLSLVYASYPLP